MNVVPAPGILGKRPLLSYMPEVGVIVEGGRPTPSVPAGGRMRLVLSKTTNPAGGSILRYCLVYVGVEGIGSTVICLCFAV